MKGSTLRNKHQHLPPFEASPRDQIKFVWKPQIGTIFSLLKKNTVLKSNNLQTLAMKANWPNELVSQTTT